LEEYRSGVGGSYGPRFGLVPSSSSSVAIHATTTTTDCQTVAAAAAAAFNSQCAAFARQTVVISGKQIANCKITAQQTDRQTDGQLQYRKQQTCFTHRNRFSFLTVQLAVTPYDDDEHDGCCRLQWPRTSAIRRRRRLNNVRLIEHFACIQ